MYSIIIVDDEVDIRKGIVESVDWNSIGYEVVGQAANGSQAIELVESLAPDVVLTDIRMPGIDGVKLMEYIRERHPYIKVVVSSGYSDYEYMSAAIQNRVFTYLLKPCTPYQLQDTFLKLHKELEVLAQERQANAGTAQKYDEQVIALCKLLHKQPMTDAELGTVNEVVAWGSTCLWAAAVEEDYGFFSRYHCDARNALKQEIALQLQELAHSLGNERGMFFLSSQSIIVGIHSCQPDVLQQLVENQTWLDSITVHLCNGGILEKPADLASALERARFALDGRSNVECGQSMLSLEPEYPPQYTLGKALLEGDIAMLHVELSPFFNSLADNGGYSFEQIDFFCMKLFLLISEAAKGVAMSLTNTLNETGESLKCLYEITTLSGKQQYLLYIVKLLLDEQKVHTTHDGNRVLANQMLEIIEQNYLDQQFSLNFLACQLGKSPAHLSAVFKREQGVSYMQYVRSKRLSYAQHLLAGQNLKVSEVAQMVGYADISAFIKYYKQQYGFTPSEAQNRHRGNIQ